MPELQVQPIIRQENPAVKNRNAAAAATQLKRSAAASPRGAAGGKSLLAAGKERNLPKVARESADACQIKLAGRPSIEDLIPSTEPVDELDSSKVAMNASKAEREAQRQEQLGVGARLASGTGALPR